MTTTAIKLPAIYTEDRGDRVRVGFRVPGTRRKVQRTFDYAYEGETWAEDARRRVTGAVLAGQDVEAVVADVLGQMTAETLTLPATIPAPAISAPAPTISATSPTLRRFSRTWLDVRRGSIERSTWDGYETHVNKILAERGGAGRPALAGMPIDEIRRSDVEAWRTRELDRGVPRPTLNARLKVLRMILRFALSDRLIPSDPTEPIALLNVDQTRKPTLDDEGEARLIAAIGDDEVVRLAVLLGIYCGLRSEEVLALTPFALIRTDDGRHYLSINRVRRRDGSIRRFTKDGESRLVPIGGSVLALWRRVALPVAPDDLLFAWTYDNFRHRVWRGLTDRAGLNRQKSTAKGTEAVRFGFHSLRHTCATRLAAAGMPRVEIAEFLGHADESTTAIYVHAGIDGKRHDAALAAFGMMGDEGVA